MHCNAIPSHHEQLRMAFHQKTLPEYYFASFVHFQDFSEKFFVMIKIF